MSKLEQIEVFVQENDFAVAARKLNISTQKFSSG